MEVSEFPRLLSYRGQASLAAALITIQKSQARLPSMPKQPFGVALGAARAEAKLPAGQGEPERRLQGHSDTWQRDGEVYLREVLLSFKGFGL